MQAQFLQTDSQTYLQKKLKEFGSKRERLQLNHPPNQKHNVEIPGISNQPPSSQTTSKNGPEVIEVDKELQIVIPQKNLDDQERQFIFEPYSQGYIMRVIKLLHVILPEIQKEFAKSRLS